VGITTSADGLGCWLVGADGGVFAFGDASYLGGGSGGIPRVGLISTSDGGGYLLPSSTGQAPGIYGDATAFAGVASSGPMPLAALVTGATMQPAATGYWEASSDGACTPSVRRPLTGPYQISVLCLRGRSLAWRMPVVAVTGCLEETGASIPSEGQPSTDRRLEATSKSSAVPHRMIGYL